jgi:hypothetical protein
MWPSLISTVIGLWLMAAPAALGYGEPASTVDYIVGPIAASTAWVSMWAVTRPIRWFDVPLGVALIAAPFVLGYPLQASVNSVVAGLILALLAPVRDRPTARFGGGWTAVLRGSREQDRGR